MKSGLFEGPISNGPVLKWPGFSFGYSTNHSKPGHFCSDFKWFLTKWRPFVQTSNGWTSRFQIPFEIQTICNPTSFWPFEIQTRSDFRSPLYLIKIWEFLLFWICRCRCSCSPNSKRFESTAQTFFCQLLHLPVHYQQMFSAAQILPNISNFDAKFYHSNFTISTNF